jgi:hypothetical protein
VRGGQGFYLYENIDRGFVEAAHQTAELGAVIFSATVVEPRISTNSLVITTSAPPGYLALKASQAVQNRGF